MISAKPTPTGIAASGWLSRDALAHYRVWDSMYWPRQSGPERSWITSFEALLPQLDRFGIERVCVDFPLGLDAATPDPLSADESRKITEGLERWPDRLLGFAVLNAAHPRSSLDHLDRWVKDGPMVGLLFPSSAHSLVCTDPKLDRIVTRAHQLGAVIMQHTWDKTGGKDSTGESTSADLAQLARRHPRITFVCVHAGGEWEKGIRAVQDCPNVVVETSGFDPTAGFIEMAVRELGAARIIYGGHLPSRSLGTELGKVLGADISDADRRLILGGNLRRLLRPILTRKGFPPEKIAP